MDSAGSLFVVFDFSTEFIARGDLGRFTLVESTKKVNICVLCKTKTKVVRNTFIFRAFFWNSNNLDETEKV